jgi:hypothetical protein
MEKNTYYDSKRGWWPIIFLGFDHLTIVYQMAYE